MDDEIMKMVEIRNWMTGDIICAGECDIKELVQANKNGLECADLRETDLRRLDLSGANLRHAWLNSVDFRNTILDSADLRGAKLNRSVLWHASLKNADLRGADLSDTDCWSASFKGANLENANLRDAHLIDTDIADFHVGGSGLRFDF